MQPKIILTRILTRTGLTPICIIAMPRVLPICIVSKGHNGNIGLPNTIWTNCEVRSNNLSGIGASRFDWPTFPSARPCNS